MSSTKKKEILKYIERKIFPYKLNETSKSKLNILNDKYELEELKKAVDISFTKYIFYDKDGNINADSVNTFFSKIGGIAYNNSLPPINKQINYIKNICKNKFVYWNDTEATSILNDYIKALEKWGWSEEQILFDLENETMNESMKCSNWTQWRGFIQSWIKSIDEQISKSKLEIKENSLVSFEKRYSVLNEIGSGSFGITYICLEKRLNKKFVIKDFSCERISSLENEEFFKKFIIEIDSLFNLHHQNIVSIYDYYIDVNKHRAFYVMEYIDGGNIEEFLKRNPNECNNLFIQAINVFCYLENKKMCHRDIRINNILVSSDCQLKLIDFGFIKNIDNSISVHSATKLINYPYSVPEELNNTKPKYDCKTDIYFLGKLFEDLINNLKLEKFKYSKILNKMTSYNKKERYSTFKSILKDLSKK